MIEDEEPFESECDEDPRWGEWRRHSTNRLKFDLCSLYELLRRSEGSWAVDKSKGSVDNLDELIYAIVILEEGARTNKTTSPSLTAVSTAKIYLQHSNLHCDLLTNRILVLILTECLQEVDKVAPDDGSVEYLKNLQSEHSVFGSLSMLGFALFGWLTYECVRRDLTFPAILCSLIFLRLLLGSWLHQFHRLLIRKRVLMAKVVLRHALVEIVRGEFNSEVVCRRLRNAEADGILCQSLVYSLLRVRGQTISSENS